MSGLSDRLPLANKLLYTSDMIGSQAIAQHFRSGARRNENAGQVELVFASLDGMVARPQG